MTPCLSSGGRGLAHIGIRKELPSLRLVVRQFQGCSSSQLPNFCGVFSFPTLGLTVHHPSICEVHILRFGAGRLTVVAGENIIPKSEDRALSVGHLFEKTDACRISRRTKQSSGRSALCCQASV